MATPEWVKHLVVGDRALVCCIEDAGGAAVEWHERVLLARIVDTHRVVISRDSDIFEEDPGERDGLRKLGAGGVVPAAPRGSPVFLIAHFAFGQDRQYYMDLGEALAKGLRRGDVVPAGAAEKPGPPEPPPGRRVAAERRGGLEVGEALVAHIGEWLHVASDRCLFTLTDGAVLAGGLEGSVEPAVATAAEDSRILPAKKGGIRRHRRSFTGALHAMSEVDFGTDWEIEGPRSALFVADRIHGTRGRFSGTLMEVALTIDQVQVCSLASFELISRRYQMWESARKDLLREVDAGSAGGDDWLNERSLFLGVKNLRSSAIAMPELEDFVARELPTRAAVLKERRKAREEAALAKGIETPSAKQTAKGKKGVIKLYRVRQRDVLPTYLAAASEALQGTRPGYAGAASAVGARVNFERGNASLPTGRSGQVPLSGRLPVALQPALEDRSILLSAEEVAARQREFGGDLFLGPALRDQPRLFGEFAAEFLGAGVLEASEDVLE
ncbi:unnamed protein product, partial [Prorocentrum cordatum]